LSVKAFFRYNTFTMHATVAAAYRTEDFIVELATEFLEPVGRRSPYTASRLAVLQDGSTMPVLQLLAERKFGKWEEEYFPFWVDGNRRNETLGNVDLATRASRVAKRARRARNSFGVPAGTKEYMKKWRAANKDKVRTAQSQYATRRRSALHSASDALEAVGDPLVEPEVPSALSKLEAAVSGQPEPEPAKPDQRADLRWPEDR
jgi:hypothetical protein